MSEILPIPRQSHAVVVGGGTMGADVATVLARGGANVTVVDPQVTGTDQYVLHVRAGLESLHLGHRADRVRAVVSLNDLDWTDVTLVIECIPEQLEAKQKLFAKLVDIASANTVLASNSSSFPISLIGKDLRTQERMIGLHFFMPAHLVPLVEVVMGPQTALGVAEALKTFMQGCGSMPVLVKKDKPGFLANRMQHALAREAFALIDEGVASPEDVDIAVRFGFGFRFLAAGPALQRDHAGLEVHTSAAASMYPSLCNDSAPAQALSERVAKGQLGMKTGQGFYQWSEEAKSVERTRYNSLLTKGLELLSSELPPIDRSELH